MIIAADLLRRFWWAPFFAVLVLLLVHSKIENNMVEAMLAAEQEAHKQTEANYRAAAVEAERRALANVVRVKSEQEKISNAEVEKLYARAADSDARYQRLLAQAKAYSSRPASPDMPDTSDATCRAYAGTGCDAIPALLKAAQDNTDRLVRWQSWASAQSQVNTNGPIH